MAALKGRADLVLSIIDHGASIYACDHLGRTPLHLAALRGKIELFTILVRRWYAGLRATDHRGLTPLGLAAKSGQNQFLAQLLKGKVFDISSQSLEDLGLNTFNDT